MIQTLQPVLLYGRYEWDGAALPAEELDTRLAAVCQLMRDNGWDGLVVLGDARENADLCYLTNVVPNQRWDMALIGLDRPIRIVASVGPRDLPAVIRLTPVEDVRASRNIKAPLANWLDDMSKARSPGRLRIGVANLDHMRTDIGREVADVCGDYGELADATSSLTNLRRRKSACELSLLRRSYEILQGALVHIERRRRSGASVAAAMIAGERQARRDGAQDVRLLCGTGGRGALRPVSDAFNLETAATWSVYMAVRYSGYWTEAAAVLSPVRSPAACAVRTSLERALAVVRPGVAGRELYEAIAPALAGYEPHLMLGRKFARAQGLSLDDEHWITADSSDALVEDGVYTIMAGARDAHQGDVLDSATVIVGKERSRVMWPVMLGMEQK